MLICYFIDTPNLLKKKGDCQSDVDNSPHFGILENERADYLVKKTV